MAMLPNSNNRQTTVSQSSTKMAAPCLLRARKRKATTTVAKTVKAIVKPNVRCLVSSERFCVAATSFKCCIYSSLATASSYLRKRDGMVLTLKKLVGPGVRLITRYTGGLISLVNASRDFPVADSEMQLSQARSARRDRQCIDDIDNSKRFPRGLFCQIFHTSGEGVDRP